MRVLDLEELQIDRYIDRYKENVDRQKERNTNWTAQSLDDSDIQKTDLKKKNLAVFNINSSSFQISSMVPHDVEGLPHWTVIGRHKYLVWAKHLFLKYNFNKMLNIRSSLFSAPLLQIYTF